MDKENQSTKKENIKKEKVITLKINSNLIMTVALVILIIISVAQAAQLNTLKGKISAGEVQAATTTTNTSSSGTSSSNLQNLPDMVGGC